MACAGGDPAVDDRGVVLAAAHGYTGGDPAAVTQSSRPDLSRRPATAVPLSRCLDDSAIDPRRIAFPAFRAWGERYSCSPPGAPFTEVQQRAGCGGGAAVDWWPIDGLGHVTWSCSSAQWHNLGIRTFFTKRIAPRSTTCT